MLDPVVNESDTYREWTPPRAWRAAVACCWEQRVASERVQRVVPDGCGDLLIFADGGAQAVGLADQVALVSLAAGTRIRGVRLRPEAVASAFGVAATELRNQSVDLADVVGARRSGSLLRDGALDAWIRSIEPDARIAAAVRLWDSRAASYAACSSRQWASVRSPSSACAGSNGSCDAPSRARRSRRLRPTRATATRRT